MNKITYGFNAGEWEVCLPNGSFEYFDTESSAIDFIRNWEKSHED